MKFSAFITFLWLESAFRLILKGLLIDIVKIMEKLLID